MPPTAAAARAVVDMMKDPLLLLLLAHGELCKLGLEEEGGEGEGEEEAVGGQ